MGCHACCLGWGYGCSDGRWNICPLVAQLQHKVRWGHLLGWLWPGYAMGLWKLVICLVGMVWLWHGWRRAGHLADWMWHNFGVCVCGGDPLSDCLWCGSGTHGPCPPNSTSRLEEDCLLLLLALGTEGVIRKISPITASISGESPNSFLPLQQSL